MADCGVILLRRPPLAVLLSSTLLAAFAQPQGPALAALTGSTLRGEVVLLYFWHTQCVPGLQKMGSCATTRRGGASRSLVLINTNRDRADALAYLQTLRDVDRRRMLPMALWSGNLAYGGGSAASTTSPRCGCNRQPGRRRRTACRAHQR